MNQVVFSPDIQLKKASISDGTFSGFGAVFNNKDRANDRILKGAFLESLAQHRKAGTMPRLLWAHDQSQPIGKWVKVAESDHGLEVTGKLNLKVSRAAEIYELLKDAPHDYGLSIGYTVQESERGEDGTTLLTKLDVAEVSLVSIPCNEQARVTDVKAISKPSNIREFEAAARDVLGFSSREAKRLAAGGFNCYARRDGDLAVETVLALKTLRDSISTYSTDLDRVKTSWNIKT